MTVSQVVLFNPRSSAGRTPVLPMSLLAVGAVLENRYPYVIVDGNLIDDAVVAIEDEIDRAAKIRRHQTLRARHVATANSGSCGRAIFHRSTGNHV